MAKTPLSAASLLVLDDLRRADGKQVLKLAIKELVARGSFETGEAEPDRFSKRRGPKVPRVVLHPTGRPHGGDALLGWMEWKIIGCPSMVVDGRVAYALDDVAKRIAKGDPKIRRTVVERALADLTGRGLVIGEERKRLGLFPATRWTRTPAGDELIGAAERGRRRRTGTDTGPTIWTDTYADQHHELDRDQDQLTDAALLDAGLDTSADAGFDNAFDLSFDGAFDTAFDSAFDTGFSDGGGDSGGGGDGGGGDGGGGGGD